VASGIPANLLAYQSIPQGGWTSPDVAGSAFWPGITRPCVAGRGWTTVAAGNQ